MADSPRGEPFIVSSSDTELEANHSLLSVPNMIQWFGYSLTLHSSNHQEYQILSRGFLMTVYLYKYVMFTFINASGLAAYPTLVWCKDDADSMPYTPCAIDYGAETIENRKPKRAIRTNVLRMILLKEYMSTNVRRITGALIQYQRYFWVTGHSRTIGKDNVKKTQISIKFV